MTESNLSATLFDQQEDDNNKTPIDNAESHDDQNFEKAESLDNNADLEKKKIFRSFFNRDKKSSYDNGEESNSKKIKVIPILLVVFIIGAFAAGSYFFFSLKSPLDELNDSYSDETVSYDNSPSNQNLDPVAAELTGNISYGESGEENQSYDVPGKPAPIEDAVENIYIKKIEELSLAVNTFNSFKAQTEQKLNYLSDQVGRMGNMMSRLEAKIEDAPNNSDLSAFRNDLSSINSSISHYSDSFDRIERSVEKTNERSIMNSTKLELNNTNLIGNIDRISSALNDMSKRVDSLDNKFSRTTHMTDEPSRVTYNNKTSITTVPKSIDKYSYIEPTSSNDLTLVTEITLKKINYDTNSFILEDDYSNKYIVRIGEDIGNTLGIIDEFVDGTIDTEPFLITSKKMIITTSAGQRDN